MKFERGQNVRDALRIGVKYNHVIITRISHFHFGDHSYARPFTKHIMSNLTNPEYQNYHMFYKLPLEEGQVMTNKNRQILHNHEMSTQIKYLPNTKEDLLMLYEGVYYEVTR